MSMFCFQCEQTAHGRGCTVQGVCGKKPDVAALIDLLLYACKGIGMYAHRAREHETRDAVIDRFVLKALFSTITNVNFDPESLGGLCVEAAGLRDRARSLYEDACARAGLGTETLGGPATWEPAGNLEGLVKQGEDVTIAKRLEELGPDVTGLQELLMYGLKGMGAYAYHAIELGEEDEEAYAFFHEALSFLGDDPTDTDKLLQMCLKCGEVNLRVMELLDAGNTEMFGHPLPSKVRVEPLKGKAILISGHDLIDLVELLKQTKGKGINVYTHGEMLPAHGYPGLKKYKHLVGNYGSAWQNQRKEFPDFPGAILMTTNCIQEPKNSYGDRIFTSGPVQWPGVIHIANRDFAPVIEAALAAEGFAQDGPYKEITVGFGHKTVLSIAENVVEAVKSGLIRHFFLIGGCDGAKSGRNYYTEFAEAVPNNCVMLTLACGKYRFNKLDFGEIGGIPRLLDMGQCNDAYSAVVVAQALARAFRTDVNSLPLSLILSWYEQKAVVILLSLLHLGLRNMRLGPSLPAFLTPALLQVLVEKFNIMPITTAKEDLKAILG
jgi:hydroxylamine reductase